MKMKNYPKCIIVICFIFLFSFLKGVGQLQAKTLRIGGNLLYKNLADVVGAVNPGDTIWFQKGVYKGDQMIRNLKGLEDAWITICADDSVVIRGGQTAWQFSDPAFLHIEGFTFEEQTANGLNIDDGGDYSTPAHHIIFKHCTFRNIKASGNNDLLKLSGLDQFEIVNCRFKNGSPGGSGIDMVGCHQGKIEACHFENQGSNSIQAKGGSQHILIFRNLFVNGGQRSVNLGGSTGTPFFRPLNAAFEAADLEVYSNIFVGSDAPVAFVGSIRSKVINNTIYKPGRWVVRILQENADTRLVQCGENSFENNLIVYENLRTETNVGANTRPATFQFSNNFWFDASAGQVRQPFIPVQEKGTISGENPMLMNPEKSDFRPAKNSPVINRIKYAGEPVSDFYNRPFKNFRSFGAIESE